MLGVGLFLWILASSQCPSIPVIRVSGTVEVVVKFRTDGIPEIVRIGDQEVNPLYWFCHPGEFPDLMGYDDGRVEFTQEEAETPSLEPK